MCILQKDGHPSKKDRVVLLLQDMLEVVTRDMMVNEIRLVNSIIFCTIFAIFLGYNSTSYSVKHYGFIFCF